MKIYVSCQITIREPTRIVYKWIIDNLTLENPQFYKLEKMGKYTGNTPQEIKLYQCGRQTVLVPFGCITDLWKLHPVLDDWIINIKPIQKINYNSKIKLYDYQERAVQAAVRKKNGILIMPCGAGKTQSGLEIIARVGGKALWLTHTQDLLNQSKKRAESVLQIDGSFGTITEGKADIGTHITFATVQTLSRMDLSQYRNEFDVIVVDECQHAAAGAETVTQFYKVLSGLTARYKIGLTATPKRADGLEKSMFAILGDVIHEVSREEVAEKTCKVVIKTVETNYMPNMTDILTDDGIINYAALIDDLINDEDRFKKVLEVIENLDGSAIVLANRVLYLQKLNKAYSGKSVCLSGMGYTQKAKSERKAALENLKNGDLPIIFSTYALAAEGLDCPTLKYIVFATPEKNPTLIEQSVGRVMRKAINKEYGTVIDFVDEFPMYKKWHILRKSVYKKLEV